MLYELLAEIERYRSNHDGSNRDEMWKAYSNGEHLVMHIAYGVCAELVKAAIEKRESGLVVSTE